MVTAYSHLDFLDHKDRKDHLDHMNHMDRPDHFVEFEERYGEEISHNLDIQVPSSPLLVPPNSQLSMDLLRNYPAGYNVLPTENPHDVINVGRLPP